MVDDQDLLGCLTDKGQGMAYKVTDSAIKPNYTLVYTLTKNDMVNIYSLPKKYDHDATYKPVKVIAKQNMIQFLNDHNAAAAVKLRQAEITINN